jgi:hypothetical protein
MKKCQQATHGIVHLGLTLLSSLRSVQWYAKGCSPFQLLCNLTGNRPQGLTGYIAKRCTQLPKTIYSSDIREEIL